MKSSVLVLVLVLFIALLAFFGCRRSYTEADLLGSWQIVARRIKPNDQLLPMWLSDTNPVSYTYTLSPDHSFISRFKSSKDMRVFGVWSLESDQLSFVMFSNSWTPSIASNRETVRITSLTKTEVTIEDRDQRDQLQQRTFRKLE
jgi:hypothetical protein